MSFGVWILICRRLATPDPARGSSPKPWVGVGITIQRA